MRHKLIIETIKLSVLAGMCISVAGYIYLTVGGVVGAILFSVGLLGVLHFGGVLYTGVIRDTFNIGWSALYKFPVVIIGNVIGCFLTALVLNYPDASEIIDYRCQASILEAFYRGIGCGFIMTLAVSSVKICNNFWPLLLGVPAFILSGMWHSIADAYYISAAGSWLNASVVINWLMIVLGNFVGGIIAPVLLIKKSRR